MVFCEYCKIYAVCRGKYGFKVTSAGFPIIFTSSYENISLYELVNVVLWEFCMCIYAMPGRKGLT